MKKFDKESQKLFIRFLSNTLSVNLICYFFELIIHKMNLSDNLSINTNALKINLKIIVTTNKFRAIPRENPHQRKTERKDFIYEI